MGTASRDDLLDEIKYGRLSPTEGEAAAARLGFGPLATSPDARRFKPMDEVGWTLPMTVAWITWRDPERVLRFYDPYRTKCFDWHFREWRIGFDGPIHEGYFLEERRPATLPLLLISEQLNIEGSSSKARDAQAMLWEALQAGRLEATGIPNPEMPRIPISAHEWHDLKAVEERGRDVLRRDLSSTVGYDKVIIPRQQVLALWPESRPQAKFQLPPTVRPDGPGDFPLYLAAQWIATKGGTCSFEPNDNSIWNAAFEELRARIASGEVSVIGVREGKPERIDPFIFSASLKIGHPFSDDPLDLILSEELYLSPSVCLDAEHWHKGFNDSLQTRRGVEWAKLTVLKSEIAQCWPFAGAVKERIEAPTFRTGAPGRPTPIHLVLAEHTRRLGRGETEVAVAAEAEHLRGWLRLSYPDVPLLTSKTIQNRIRAAHRAAKNTRNKNIG